MVELPTREMYTCGCSVIGGTSYKGDVHLLAVELPTWEMYTEMLVTAYVQTVY
jgi:hypothetical protein